MKSKFFLTMLLFIGIEVFSQTAVCGCGSKARGKTIEYSIIRDGSTCCGGTVTGPAYTFEWEHQGGGVYLLVSLSRYELSSQAQRDCCENS